MTNMHKMVATMDLGMHAKATHIHVLTHLPMSALLYHGTST